jgi:hypothetical protein
VITGDKHDVWCRHAESSIRGPALTFRARRVRRLSLTFASAGLTPPLASRRIQTEGLPSLSANVRR